MTTNNSKTKQATIDQEKVLTKVEDNKALDKKPEVDLTNLRRFLPKFSYAVQLIDDRNSTAKVSLAVLQVEGLNTVEDLFKEFTVEFMVVPPSGKKPKVFYRFNFNAMMIKVELGNDQTIPYNTAGYYNVRELLESYLTQSVSAINSDSSELTVLISKVLLENLEDTNKLGTIKINPDKFGEVALKVEDLYKTANVVIHSDFEKLCQYIRNRQQLTK